MDHINFCNKISLPYLIVKFYPIIKLTKAYHNHSSPILSSGKLIKFLPL